MADGIYLCNASKSFWSRASARSEVKACTPCKLILLGYLFSSLLDDCDSLCKPCLFLLLLSISILTHSQVNGVDSSRRVTLRDGGLRLLSSTSLQLGPLTNSSGA